MVSAAEHWEARWEALGRTMRDAGIAGGRVLTLRQRIQLGLRWLLDLRWPSARDEPTCAS